MLLWLYRLLFVPVLLLLSPRYLWRMRKRGGYGANMAHRFGCHPRRNGRAAPRIWLQAVSVGEMLAIEPLLRGLHADGVEVYLTTTTSTGARVARERYSNFVAGLGYFPIDWLPFSAWAWDRIRPDLVVLTEGEWWPEHLHQARRHGVRVLSINARISDRSFARLRRFPAGASLVLAGVSRFLAGSEQDERRLRELGVPADRVLTTGNLKLDLEIPLLNEAERSTLRRELGLRDGLVLLGSSTWPGEEAALLAAWRKLRAGGLAVSLLIVPRHAERRGQIAALLRDADVTAHFRSQGAALEEVDVSVGDTTGELRRLTQLADVVFVGKSLPPHTEGQTPVEAAVLGKPVLFGPGMSNFRLLAADLVARGAARVVSTPDALAQESERLLRDAAARAEPAAAAARWRRENSGALGRTLAVLREEIASLSPRPGAAV